MKKLTVIFFGAVGFLLLFVTFYSYNQRTRSFNEVRDRGQTRVQDGGPDRLLTVSGILVSASCPDRSPANLDYPPEGLQAEAPAEPTRAARNNAPMEGAVSAYGIRVDPGTVAAEHADIAPHQVPDVRTRQEDPTCAITASTAGFSLLMDNGRLVDLDEGGNTLAEEAVLANSNGRAMLNGMAPGLKPRVVMRGFLVGDRLVVTELVKMA